MANIFEFLSKAGNITPEKARKSRQMQFHDKQCMFGVFAIDEILRYQSTPFVFSRTLCHPDCIRFCILPFEDKYIVHKKFVFYLVTCCTFYTIGIIDLQ